MIGLHSFRNFFLSEITKTSNKTRRKHASFVRSTFHNFIPPGVPCHNRFRLTSIRRFLKLDVNLFVSANHFYGFTENLSGVVLFCYTLFTMDKFVVKEKKNNPKLAVNIMQAIEKEIMHQGVLHTDTFVVFRWTGKWCDFYS